MTDVQTPEFSVVVTPGSPFNTVAAVGELDVATVDELWHVLSEHMSARSAVLLDLSGVTFMDSTGLSLMIRAIREASVNGWDLGVSADLSDPVKTLFDMTMLSPRLPIIEE